MRKIMRERSILTARGITLVLFLVLAAVCSAFASEQTTVIYTFEQPVVDKVSVGSDIYDRVAMADCPNGGDVGEPALPATGARILLPYGTEVESIEILEGQKVALGSGFRIIPNSEQAPLNLPPTEMKPPVPDPEVYASLQPQPGELFENVGVQSFRGYQILILKLHPVQYIPASGELYYYPDMTVVVNTLGTGKSSPLFRGLAEDLLEVQTRIDNPENAFSYNAAPKSGGKSFDLLIVTTPELASGFVPLKNYHDAEGILTEIHTTADAGSSDPDDIRAYITNKYLNDGIDYVIIGADDDIIPARDLFVPDPSIYPDEYHMPGDLYFSCLDGTYNNDGDTCWGEYNDGDGGGDVDLVAEVYLGRASAGDLTEVGNLVNKTIYYASSTDPYLHKVLMVGEYLGFGGVSQYANNILNELIDSCSTHYYTTIGIPSSIFDVQTLYEADSAWTQADLQNCINSGVHIINHLGHGNVPYAMQFYNEDIMNLLTNADPFMVYSQACLSGAFDNTEKDCWAEYATVKTEYGAFAAIMNSRSGIAGSNTTDGASHRYNREFWDAVFSPQENRNTYGRAIADAKEDNLYRINELWMRYCYYEINLLGDPSLKVGAIGIAIEYPSGVPRYLLPETPTTIEVNVVPVGYGVPVPGTGQLHYSISGGDFETVAMTEITPNQYETSLPAVACGEYIEFYFSAEEENDGVIYSPNPSTPYLADVATSVPAVFQDDFETDNGWSISGGDWNRGIPRGWGGEYGYPDPGSGCVGTSVFGYNLNGDYENNLPEKHITSRAIDCTGLNDTRLRFWRWLGVGIGVDRAYVRISTDGTTWNTLWVNQGNVLDNRWVLEEFDISEYADDQATVYLRFTMGPTDSGYRYCGWNIDGLEVVGYKCQPQIDSDNDGHWDYQDNCPLTFNPDQEDSDADGLGDSIDNDLVGDSCDNCRNIANSSQEDFDDDAVGDSCDNCLAHFNPLQEDFDVDAVGDSCDNCIETFNPDQADADGDGIGDVCDWICGNADGSGGVDIDDVVYLISYIFAGGSAPEPLQSGDADCSGASDIDDVVYLIAYIFSGGPAPCDTDGDEVPDC